MFIVPKLSSYTHQASGKLNSLKIKMCGRKEGRRPIPKFQMCAMLPAFRLPGSVNSLPMADGVSFLSFHPVVASSLVDVWDISQPWELELLSISLWTKSFKFDKAVGLLSGPPNSFTFISVPPDGLCSAPLGKT